jgi:hypothetical protein
MSPQKMRNSVLSPHFQVKTYRFSQNFVTVTQNFRTLMKPIIGVVILKMVDLHCCITCLDNADMIA